MSTDAFPSLLIRRDALVPRGAFAEAQAAYLYPDAGSVAELAALLEAKQVGVVAHFYMDVELQGVLSACSWPQIHVSDSLAMADRAIGMVEAGVKAIVVLGVDFMSENVRAVLDHAGHSEVPVYRLAAAPIGCSLAESAEAPAYAAWLRQAARTPRSLHVVYINTSLQTKAAAHTLVPTLTCTSSNVVQTVLQAAAQVPELTIWYGPDTYMGENLHTLFSELATLPDAQIAALHPAHSQATISDLLTRFHYYPQGNCVVHHLFGAEVVARVLAEHPDALYTAHLEVPGEMFALATRAQADGRGVVGSTSNILAFVAARVAAAAAQPRPTRLELVLGTEAGMITSIVERVQQLLNQHERDDISVEIVFPVASEAVAEAPESSLGIVPGVAGGEGCSVAGGCATCPFMKMNSLEALFEVVEGLGVRDQSALAPRSYHDTMGGRTVAEVGGEPILFMRDFQRGGVLPDALVQLIVG